MRLGLSRPAGTDFDAVHDGRADADERASSVPA